MPTIPFPASFVRVVIATISGDVRCRTSRNHRGLLANIANIANIVGTLAHAARMVEEYGDYHQLGHC